MSLFDRATSLFGVAKVSHILMVLGALSWGCSDADAPATQETAPQAGKSAGGAPAGSSATGVPLLGAAAGQRRLGARALQL